MEKALQETCDSAAKLLVVSGANHGLDKKNWTELMKPMVDFLNQQVDLPEHR